jgi:hypothetical protein
MPGLRTPGPFLVRAVVHPRYDVFALRSVVDGDVNDAGQHLLPTLITITHLSGGSALWELSRELSLIPVTSMRIPVGSSLGYWHFSFIDVTKF